MVSDGTRGDYCTHFDSEQDVLLICDEAGEESCNALGFTRISGEVVIIAQQPQ